MHDTSLNSQSIILLTGYFNKGDKPLSIAEYSRFALWLKEHGASPGDLLQGKLEDLLEGWSDKRITIDRIQSLLDRGNAMAIAMQKWQNAGIWVMTRADSEYPKRLKRRLGHKAPPIFYGAGDKKILQTRGVAIVGSRNVGENDLEFSFHLGEKLAVSGYSVVSGAARGVDESSMLGSISAEGTTVGVVAEGLMKKTLSKKYRNAIMNGNLILLSPYYPDARFSVGNAMGRNKYIYTLADSSVVVYSGLDGGTWEGAIENLRHRWVPLYVKKNTDERSGNARLIEQGGISVESNILEKENFDFLFENEKLSEEKEEENSSTNLNSTTTSTKKRSTTIEEQIIELLSKHRLTIKKIATELGSEEKTVKKTIDRLVKEGELEKHRNRPLQFSKKMTLPGME